MASGLPGTCSTSTPGWSRTGYLTWAGEQDADGRSDTDVGFAEMTRHVHALDWSRTVAYAATPSSQGIHIVEADARASETPMPEDVRAQLAAEIATALRGVTPPARRAPAGGGGVDPRAGLRRPIRGARSRPLGRARRRRHDLDPALGDDRGTRARSRAGHHRWEGIFIAAGPGDPRRQHGRRAVDRRRRAAAAAPARARRSRRHVGQRPARRSSSPAELASRPALRVPAAARGRRLPAPRRASSSTPEEQAAVIERLRALGYVE